MLHRNATLLVAAVAMTVTAVQAQAQAAWTRFRSRSWLPRSSAVRLMAQSPKVGDVAPDFTLNGSTKDGLLPKPIHLADFRGQTVVLAFFPKARTKG